MTDDSTRPSGPLGSLAVSQVRGLGIQAFRATILAGLTSDRQELLLENLGPAARNLMCQPPAAEAWVPVELLREIRSAYGGLFDMRLEKVRAFTMASLMFSHPHFEDLRGTRNIATFLARFCLLWQACHDGGCIEGVQRAPHQARVTIWARFPYPQYLDEVMPPALREALQHLGFTGGRVDQQPHPVDMHAYDLNWDL